MKILVVGGGGREHAIVWKLAQSARVTALYCAPGNAGIGRQAQLVPIRIEEVGGLLAFARENGIDLTVVGPELPLARGIVDTFRRAGLRIVGPSQAAAQLETSKVYAKEFMLRYKIPTAAARIFYEPDAAYAYLQKQSLPLVIKADGLASGKGVVVAHTESEAAGAIDAFMRRRIFGEAGRRVLVEECLTGPEVSLLIATDGRTVRALAPSQDHKRIFDGDRGPNTGGMGAFCPAEVLTDALRDQVLKEIVHPTLSGLHRESRPYSGILYFGLMLTPAGPKVLEYNARLGDPETQSILPRLTTDLAELFEALAEQRLSDLTLGWDPQVGVCVVLAAGGYPEEPRVGQVIHGLDEAAAVSGITLFHAGTARRGTDVVTAGGRVLGVTALGRDLAEARARAYQAVDRIRFDGMQYRKDIGLAAIGA